MRVKKKSNTGEIYSIICVLFYALCSLFFQLCLGQLSTVAWHIHYMYTQVWGWGGAGWGGGGGVDWAL